MQSQAWRDRAQAGKEIQRQQARVLLVQERAHRAQKSRVEKIQTPEQLPQRPGLEESALKDRAAELARLKTASRRYAIYHQQRQTKLDNLHEQLQENQLKKEAVEQEVSQADQLIEQNMVRLDTGAKRLMDAIKITARNLFYQTLAPFREAYDNYRDDHDYFRQLTLTAGVLRWTGQEMKVHLVPHLNYSPQLTNIIRKLMTSLNERKPALPDGSQRPLRFRLTRKEEIVVHLQIRSGPA